MKRDAYGRNGIEGWTGLKDMERGRDVLNLVPFFELPCRYAER